jgi:hypothetical protein
VWKEHLLPLLTATEAARLGCTCKALRHVVREHFKGDLGTIKPEHLQAALTTFPRARTVELDDPVDEFAWESKSISDWVRTQGGALVQWLCEGGRGRGLERVTTSESSGIGVVHLVHDALQAGALPSLKNISASLEHPTHAASLTNGLVAAMHELRIEIRLEDHVPVEAQLAALGLVRQLPALAKLEVRLRQGEGDPVQWPPFIPPSLKALRVMFWVGNPSSVESLLLALPDLLEASGASLERLEILFPCDVRDIGDGLVHLAPTLRCCSPTLKHLFLGATVNRLLGVEAAEIYPDQVERLRVQWTGVLAGVSACHELQVLVLPWLKVEPLFPPGTAFARLTHLEISDREREHPPDAGMMGLWELMVSGGLPALAKLRVRLEDQWRGSEHVKSRVAPAFEAVAGTLTCLLLEKCHYLIKVSDQGEAAYELGVAVGKLRRLKDLTLGLSQHGRAHQVFAQGLAASGGDRPLPLLWRVGLGSTVCTDADLVASLLLPSVRVFCSCHANSQAALLTACALRQAGYKHTWIIHWTGIDSKPELERAALLAIAACKIIIHRDFEESFLQSGVYSNTLGSSVNCGGAEPRPVA